ALAEGFTFDPDDLGFDAIREVGPGGSFITHPSTLEGFRSLSRSELFPNWSPEAWDAAGRPSGKDRVRERIRQLLAGHNFELDPALRRELDRLYDAFVEQVR